MEILKKLIGIFVIYSMAFATPVVARPKSSEFKKIKSYLNSKGKKSYRSLFSKMEKDLPSRFYETSIKRLKGKAGKGFFDSAKINNKYAYFRFNNSKILIRFKTKKGKMVFLANGIEINEEDFRDMKIVRGKLILAQIKGKANQKKGKKTSFLELIKWNQAFAANYKETMRGNQAGDDRELEADPICPLSSEKPCEAFCVRLMDDVADVVANTEFNDESEIKKACKDVIRHVESFEERKDSASEIEQCKNRCGKSVFYNDCKKKCEGRNCYDVLPESGVGYRSLKEWGMGKKCSVCTDNKGKPLLNDKNTPLVNDLNCSKPAAADAADADATTDPPVEPAEPATGSVAEPAAAANLTPPPKASFMENLKKYLPFIAIGGILLFILLSHQRSRTKSKVKKAIEEYKRREVPEDENPVGREEEQVPIPPPSTPPPSTPPPSTPSPSTPSPSTPSNI